MGLYVSVGTGVEMSRLLLPCARLGGEVVEEETEDEGE